MEFNKINFKVVEKALQTAGHSDQYLQAILAASASNQLDCELDVVKSQNLPAVIRKSPKELNFSN